MANFNSSHTGAEIDSAVSRVKDTAVTAGTVTASKGIVVDANKDISGFRNVTLTGQLQAATINLTGDTTIGDGDSDNITINADVNSNIIPNTDNTFDLGSASKQWKDLYVNGIGYIDQLGTDADPIAIFASSGEIDGTAIGSESASTGAFTTLTASDAVTFSKSTNGDYKTQISNANAGTATEANIYITNSSSTADGLFAGIGGTGFTTAGGFVQDGAWIGSGTGASGGLSLMTRANADMRFYTNGHTNLALTIDSSQNVGIGNTSPSSFYESHLVVGDGTGEEAITIYSGSSNIGYLLFGDATSGNARFAGQIRYDHANNKLEFATNELSTAKMTIDSSGNVGIGTSATDPYSLGSTGKTLSINSSNASTGALISLETADANRGYLFANTSNVVLSAVHTDIPLKFNTNDTTKMTIDGSGNVGIGITSPTNSSNYKTLDIRGTNGGQLLLGRSSFDFFTYSSSSKTSLGTASGQDLAFHTNSSGADNERLRITSGGDVGIGSDSPESILHIREGSSGGVGARFTLDNGSGSALNNAVEIAMLTDGGASVSGTSNVRIKAINTNASNGASDLTFTTWNGSSEGERMRIASDGNVGINQTSPDAKLHITGDSKIVNIESTSATGRCYIMFEDSSSDKGFIGYGSSQNDNFGIYNYENAAMLFATDSTQRMYIANNGGVAIGTNHSSPATLGLHVKAEDGGQATFIENSWNGSPDASSVLDVKCTNTNKALNLYRGYNGGSNVFSVQVDGDVTNTNNSYGAFSDERLKENIADATPKLDELNQVRVVNYNFKDEPDKKQLGVVAQELQEIFPKMVSEYGEDGYLRVKYSIFVPMLIKALQEADDKIDALEARIEALENA